MKIYHTVAQISFRDHNNNPVQIYVECSPYENESEIYDSLRHLPNHPEYDTDSLKVHNKAKYILNGRYTQEDDHPTEIGKKICGW